MRSGCRRFHRNAECAPALPQICLQVVSMHIHRSGRFDISASGWWAQAWAGNSAAVAHSAIQDRVKKHRCSGWTVAVVLSMRLVLLRYSCPQTAQMLILTWLRYSLIFTVRSSFISKPCTCTNPRSNNVTNPKEGGKKESSDRIVSNSIVCFVRSRRTWTLNKGLGDLHVAGVLPNGHRISVSSELLLQKTCI